jgi:hypothetical protein
MNELAIVACAQEWLDMNGLRKTEWQMSGEIGNWQLVHRS